MKKYVDERGYSTFKTIRSNETHFKLCNKCRSFNYFKNKTCVLCGSDRIDSSYDYDERSFREICKEYEFYKDKGFSTEDIDNLKISTVDIDKIKDKGKDFRLNKYLSKMFKNKNNNTIVVN